jgi:hypothetical protein
MQMVDHYRLRKRRVCLQLFVCTVSFRALVALNRIRVLAGTSIFVWSRGLRATRGRLSYVENDPSPVILTIFFSAKV